MYEQDLRFSGEELCLGETYSQRSADCTRCNATVESFPLLVTAVGIALHSWSR